PTDDAKKGLGVCYTRMSNYYAAHEFFRQTNLEGAPELTLVWTEALEGIQRFDLAVTALQEVSDKLDGQKEKEEDVYKQVTTRLASMRAKEKESGHQDMIESSRLQILFRSPDHDELAIGILEFIDQAMVQMVQDYGFVEPR